jgi:N-dimethylarginine dimethylaminohydrolase
VTFGIDSETGVLREVLLCRPQYYEWLATSDIARDSIAHQTKFDREKALKQHATLVDTLESADVKCHFIEPVAGLPDLCWTRDSSQMTPWGAAITHLSDPTRVEENRVLHEYYDNHSIPVCLSRPHNRLEGGDIHIIQPGALAVGYSNNRTNEAGAREFSARFEKEDWDVHLEYVQDRFVHLDVVFCMAATKLAIVCLEAVSAEFRLFLEQFDIETIDVSIEEVDKLACNCLALGDKRVILAGLGFTTADKLRAKGLQVTELDLDMFTLAGGGVHCLTQPLRRDQM